MEDETTSEDETTFNPFAAAAALAAITLMAVGATDVVKRVVAWNRNRKVQTTVIELAPPADEK